MGAGYQKRLKKYSKAKNALQLKLESRNVQDDARRGLGYKNATTHHL